MLANSKMISFVPTTDGDRARVFFEGVLGLPLRSDNGFALTFDVGGTMLRVTRTPSFFPQPFTIAGWEVDDLRSSMARLAEHGLEGARFEGLDQDSLGIWTAPSGDRIAWVRDPDGNVLSLSEFQHRPLGARAQQPPIVLDFWFGELDAAGLASAEISARWWKKDIDFDDSIRERFATLHAHAVAGRLDTWASTARGRLALVILLDQFSRNMFRGRPGMFASDAQAREWVLDGLASGDDQRLATDERVFLYMPLMHSESLVDQDRSVELFSALAENGPESARERLRGNHRFAAAHRDIVSRFGRFPHRNAILGRISSQEELEFLEQPGSSF